MRACVMRCCYVTRQPFETVVAVVMTISIFSICSRKPAINVNLINLAY